MEDFLKALIERKQKELNNLKTRSNESEDINEVRSIGERIDAVNLEIRDAQNQLNALEGKEKRFNPMSAVATANTNTSSVMDSDPYGTIEYRKAFKKYVQTGTQIPMEIRANATTATTDIGAIIPTTIMNEFIKEVSKVYGQVYAKVRKLNVKGGVEFPISKLTASVKWVTEAATSDRQKAGDINEKVTFSYHVAEIRVSQTLLAQVVSLDAFENEVVRIMVEAYVKAMDEAIIAGTGSGQPLGITKDSRVKNVVEFTDTEIGDWTAWRKKLFAKVPLAKRGQGEFLFAASTVESNLLTMKDKNDRPVFREATEIAMDNLAGTFFGRNVTLVEPELIKDFETAASGDVVGVYWVPQDYAVNTQMEFGVKRYFDEDTNEWINKGLTIIDGKILDPSGCFLIKKKVAQ